MYCGSSGVCETCYLLYVQEIWLEQEDAPVISEGEEVTLMDWGNAIVQVCMLCMCSFLVSKSLIVLLRPTIVCIQQVATPKPK